MLLGQIDKLLFVYARATQIAEYMCNNVYSPELDYAVAITVFRGLKIGVFEDW